MFSTIFSYWGSYWRSPRLRECCRQVEPEVVRKSKNKIHKTWGQPISGALYSYFNKI